VSLRALGKRGVVPLSGCDRGGRRSCGALDGPVDFGHEAKGFRQRRDDALVVGDVVVAERAALAVFEPLVADLVAADVEVPHLGRDAFEVLLLVDPHTAPSAGRSAPAFAVPHILHHAVSPDGVARQLRTVPFHQVQPHQLLAQSAERAEEIPVRRQRQAGKIDLEKFGVALSVGRRVKHGVHVIEYVFRTKSFLPVSLAVGDEFQLQAFGEILDEFRREVRTPSARGVGRLSGVE